MGGNFVICLICTLKAKKTFKNLKTFSKKPTIFSSPGFMHYLFLPCNTPYNTLLIFFNLNLKCSVHHITYCANLNLKHSVNFTHYCPALSQAAYGVNRRVKICSVKASEKSVSD